MLTLELSLKTHLLLLNFWNLSGNLIDTSHGIANFRTNPTVSDEVTASVHTFLYIYHLGMTFSFGYYFFLPVSYHFAKFLFMLVNIYGCSSPFYGI